MAAAPKSAAEIKAKAKENINLSKQLINNAELVKKARVELQKN